MRDNSSSLDAVAGKYGYETIFDLVNDIGSFRSSIQEDVYKRQELRGFLYGK